MKLNINGKEIEVKDDDLSKALTDKVETFELKADLIVRTADEDNLYKENVKKESTTIGMEIGRKNLFKALGIEAEGVHKSDETSIEALKGWSNGLVNKALTDAKVEPNKKLEEKEKDILTLQNTIKEEQRKREEIENGFKTYKKNETIKTTLSSVIPDNVILPKEDIMTLLSTKIKVDVDETGRVYGIGADGQPIKNTTTLEPLPIKDIIGNFFSENPQYLKGVSGGAGGTDSKDADGIQTVEKFIEEMQGLGHAPNSEQFNKIMNERIKAGLLKS